MHSRRESEDKVWIRKVGPSEWLETIKRGSEKKKEEKENHIFSEFRFHSNFPHYDTILFLFCWNIKYSTDCNCKIKLRGEIMGLYRIYITDRDLGKLYPGLSEIFYWKLHESEQFQFIKVVKVILPLASGWLVNDQLVSSWGYFAYSMLLVGW